MKATIKTYGANCQGCSLAIDHFTRRLDGVDDIEIKAGDNTVEVWFSKNEKQIIESVIEMVEKLGYSAKLQSIEKG